MLQLRMSRSGDTHPAAVTMREIRASTALARLQRVLLGADGTVTSILEAYAGEPVEVVKLLQAFDRSTEADTALVVADHPVLRRRVLLKGVRSRRSLLYAEAVVVLDRLDPAVVDGLLTSDMPIGALLAEHRAETFREILGVGREPAGAYAAHFGVDALEELLCRTYRIFVRGQPAILITERFPATSFRSFG